MHLNSPRQNPKLYYFSFSQTNEEDFFLGLYKLRMQIGQNYQPKSLLDFFIKNQKYLQTLGFFNGFPHSNFSIDL